MDTEAGILGLATAFGPAQALLTAVELGVFDALDGGPAGAEEIRHRLGLHGRGLPDLLALLAGLGLLHEQDGRYANAPGAAAHLISGRPGYVGGALRGAKTNLYPVWTGLADTLRTGEPRSAADGFAAMLDDPEALRRYARMMDGALSPILPKLMDVLDWPAHGSVLDVGGCRGDLAGRLVRAHPGLAGHVFDLPQLRPVFDEHMAELGTAGAVRFHAGDFFRDPLPAADVIVFGHVLHNWPVRLREVLLGKAFGALPSGGVLLVHDRMLDDARTHVENLVAALTMTLVTEEGAEYTPAELEAQARSAGFTPNRRIRLDANETLVALTKP